MHVPVLFTRIKRASGGRCTNASRDAGRRWKADAGRGRHTSVTEQKNTDGRRCAGSPGQPEPFLGAGHALGLRETRRQGCTCRQAHGDGTLAHAEDDTDGQTDKQRNTRQVVRNQDMRSCRGLW